MELFTLNSKQTQMFAPWIFNDCYTQYLQYLHRFYQTSHVFYLILFNPANGYR
jgi:hypothetical protein